MIDIDLLRIIMFAVFYFVVLPAIAITIVLKLDQLRRIILTLTCLAIFALSVVQLVTTPGLLQGAISIFWLFLAVLNMRAVRKK